MRAKVILSILFYWIAATALAQPTMLEEAFKDFITYRFWGYEEIPITWNMEGTIQAELNDGINNLLEENPALAEENFSKVLARDSLLWQAYYYRGASRKQLKKLNGALADLKRALKFNSDFYEGYVELAKVYHLKGQVSESERALKTAIRIDESKPIAFYLRGAIDLEQSQLRSAANYYKHCLKVDSLFHDARIKLSILDLTAKKNQDDALREMSLVLKYDSLQKSALLFRSILFYEKNEKQSIRDLSNLILVSPHNLMARYLRGFMLTKQKEYERAFTDFLEVIKSSAVSDNLFKGKQTWVDKKIDIQNVGAYTLTRVYGLSDGDAAKIKQAYCQILSGEYDLSVGILNQTSAPTKEPLCLYLIAVAYEHKGDHKKAFRFYDWALQLDNEIADAHKKRGIYEQETKQWAKSIEDFSAVLKLNPESFVTYKTRGVSYYLSNNFLQAIADFTTYIENDSTDGEVFINRGLAYLKSNQRLLGYLDIAQTENQETYNFKEMHHLVDSVLVTGDTTFALTALNKLTSAAPNFTEGFVMKFQIYIKRNDWRFIENQINLAVFARRADAKKSDHAYLLTLKAMNLAKNKHQEDAIDTFGEAIKIDSQNALAYLERGKVLLAMGKKSKAEGDFMQASALGNAQAKQFLNTRVPK